MNCMASSKRLTGGAPGTVVFRNGQTFRSGPRRARRRGLSTSRTPTDRTTVVSGVSAGMTPDREATCVGYRVGGLGDYTWTQLKAHDFGREWGDADKQYCIGILCTPTFSSYGRNAAVAGQPTAPALVMQGLGDTGVLRGAPMRLRSITPCRRQ
jgi:hypothetical protein